MGFHPTVWYWVLVAVMVAFVVVAAVRPASRRTVVAAWKRDRTFRFSVYALPLAVVAIVAYRIIFG